MGDARASVKIEFSIYGEEFKQEWWINWFPEDGMCDRRITEWFEACYSKAREKYDDELYESQRAERDRIEEATERAQLEKLKAKYETPNVKFSGGASQPSAGTQG